MVDISGTTRKTLCDSGNGRPINYYEIGSENARKQMILNFAIHGHEDAAALLEQDGYELTKLAVKLTRYLGELVESGDNLNGWRVYIIPALNPDGILYKHSGENNDPLHSPDDDYYDCNGIGRHCMNEIEWNWNGGNELTASECISKGTPVDGGHIDMNRCFMFKQGGVWTYRKGFSTPGRNYIGNGPLRAKEALYMHEFINTLFALNADDRIFIDTHGWTTQIITSDDGILKAFKDEFGYEGPNQITPLTYGEGYVARYAKDLGYRSCLFEFPKMSNTNVPNPYNFNHIEINGWDKKYINAIMTLINSPSNT